MTLASDSRGAERVPGDAITHRDLAELHASLKGDIAESERRIIERLIAHGTDAKELEDRVRAAELSVVQIRTVGSIVMAASTLFSTGLGLAGLIYSILHG